LESFMNGCKHGSVLGANPCPPLPCCMASGKSLIICLF
jgi:hypothetical protein